MKSYLVKIKNDAGLEMTIRTNAQSAEQALKHAMNAMNVKENNIISVQNAKKV